jgi:hypothetical protein
MQTIQIQEFNNISDQKIYLENIEYLKQHLNEILEVSEQTLAENLIKETVLLTLGLKMYKRIPFGDSGIAETLVGIAISLAYQPIVRRAKKRIFY